MHCKSGICCVDALISNARGDISNRERAVESFISTCRFEAREPKPDLMTGLSGVLIGCTLLSTMAPGGAIQDFGNRVMNRLADIAEGLYIGRHDHQRSKVGIAQAGIANGLAGVLYATMQWCVTNGVRLPRSTENLVDIFLAKCRVWLDKHSSLSTSLRGSWCSGFSGILHVLMLANDVYGEPKIWGMGEECASLISEDDAQQTDLCCGQTGRAYALLLFYRRSGQRKWLSRANELAEAAANRIDASSSWPLSLFKGAAGTALLLADLENPCHSRMPFFEAGALAGGAERGESGRN